MKKTVEVNLKFTRITKFLLVIILVASWIFLIFSNYQEHPLKSFQDNNFLACKISNLHADEQACIVLVKYHYYLSSFKNYELNRAIKKSDGTLLYLLPLPVTLDKYSYGDLDQFLIEDLKVKTEGKVFEITLPGGEKFITSESDS